MSALLSSALAYAHAGIPVLPLHTPVAAGRCSCRRPACERPGKHPRWHPRLITAGLHQASTDPDQLTAWWSTWPDANIGLRTGIALDVCDIDSAAGLHTVLRLTGTPVPPGPAVRTGSGGWHLYFAPSGAGNRVGLLPGVDWRGAGGYVVAPPSVHASGGRYYWTRPLAAPFPACPPALHGLLTAWPDPPPAVPATVHDPLRYGAAALRAGQWRVETAPVGQRNDTLYRTARGLGRLVVAGILGAGEVTAVLTAAALSAGLGRDETARTIRSGLATARRQPPAPPAAA